MTRPAPLPARLPAAEITLERLDPLSAAAARPVTTGAALLAGTVPLLVAVTRPSEIVQPLWFVISYLLVVAACVLLLDRSRPTRPVWQAPSAQVFQLLLMATAVTSALSTAGANERLRDDWPPLVIGILLLASTPYRPAREIVVWTALHTLFCAGLGIAQAPTAVSDVPTVTYAITGSFIVALLGLAAAAYAHSLNTSTRLWQERAWQSAAAVSREHRTGVARSVQQQRITVLNLEAVPTLQRIAEADEVTPADREEARRLAQSIRALLVADVERGWAQQMLDDVVARHPRRAVDATADDPDDLGRRAALERRTLLRALAVVAIETLDASEIVLRLQAHEGRLSVEWEITTAWSVADARRALRSMLELIRGLTRRSSLRETDGRLVLEFEYGY
ncbi:hypothetical protein [Microcella frigidaquae]|uniref:Putative membrane protein n=1 Tax=Microcella frigidaquae TaxID=424758 RepID=A0A840X5M9_9MICO|nr:hypothetical protein [Microcella frigidaquae]MBB5617690.1 putative membrane protein [Microcella frigidaquae]NHN45710.1 hypothetical protein [Microcella frigidaquae]